MERLKLYRSGQVVGELTAEPEGLYLRFHARCDLCGEGMFRAFAVGQRGEVPLGVLEPVSGQLQLSRCLSRGQLAPVGQLLRGEVRRCGGEEERAWQLPPEEVLERMPAGPAARGSLAGEGAAPMPGVALRTQPSLSPAGALLPGSGEENRRSILCGVYL